MLKQTLLDDVCNSWESCTLCTLATTASRKVIGKGTINPSVVFVGEAPGKTEDLEGRPFVGLAGKLLHQAMKECNLPSVPFYCMNLLACRPCDRIGGPNRAPSDQEIARCAPRVKTMLEILSPKTVCLLGRIPRLALAEQPWIKRFKLYCLPHPAYILRLGGFRSQAYAEFKIKIKEVLSASL